MGLHDCGSILPFEILNVKEELAITLRTIRKLKGLGYEALAGTISQSNLSLLEQGKIQATLPTLVKVAETLGINLLTLMALCLATLLKISQPIGPSRCTMSWGSAMESVLGRFGCDRHGSGTGRARRPRL